MVSRRPLITFLYLSAITFFPLASSPALAAPPLDAKAIVHGDEDGGTISRHLYGQFAEHLGRCIYDGIWVGEDSRIPNTRGMRTDIIDALRAINIPNLRWPGGCYADDYHWRNGIGPRADRPYDAQHALGPGRRHQRLRHPRVSRSLRRDRRRALHRRQRRQRHARRRCAIGSST